MFQQFYSSSVLDVYSVDTTSELELPVITAGISAGFPSPAMDFIDLTIDMNRHLVKHPSATFYGRVKGHSMKDVGIFDGDLLVIDKSLEPKNEKIAVCYLDGEFTVKRIRVDYGCIWLFPANTDFEPIRVDVDTDFIIWGIVTFVIKAF